MVLLSIVLALGARVWWQHHLNTELRTALESQQMERVQRLIASGADVETRNPWTGETALNRACLRSNAPLVEWLLGHGANPNSHTRGGWSPLFSAINGPRPRRCVELLLDRGAAVAYADDEGQTALVHAINQNQPDTIRLLIRAGADPGMADRSGLKAADWARRLKRPVLIPLLTPGN